MTPEGQEWISSPLLETLLDYLSDREDRLVAGANTVSLLRQFQGRQTLIADLRQIPNELAKAIKAEEEAKKNSNPRNLIQ